MNTNNIKKYAPQARNDFRDAVIQKLTTLGIAADKKGNLQIAEAETIGETVRYGQFDYPLSTLPRRERLVKRAREQGFEVLVEHCAYTWFNRLCAIRYMELHGYLDHGFRMLSHPETPAAFEVLDHVPEVAEALLPENKAQLVEMKLSGNQDEALYRELLLGQCHALHHAMPFLFEAVDDEAELLLPDNLTRTDSILRGLVDDIPEEDWEQVEVIGWLYQFYISEKKDAVIGKVVKSEDIPAATQLFTPNWIVQYLVQNSVGRQWLQTYPDSPLKDKMEYYIEPAEQTPGVQAQLAAITPASIEPESIKVLDPACGSGHILIEAYNVLKNIYEERGYRGRDIPQLILENNIFGLDIDDRAAQLSGFALLMMARQDDRRIFTRDVRLNIVSLQESLHLDIAKLWQQLNFHQQVQTGSMGDMFAENTALTQTDSAEYQLLMRTLKRFVNAKTLGSLIQVPQEEEAELKVFLDALYRLEQEGDLQQKAAAKAFIPFIQQAWILAQRYDAVVANPPYMGSKGMNGELKEFAKNNFPDSKSDLFAMFIERGFLWLKNAGFNSMVTMQSWMFLSSFENMRKNILTNYTIETMVHMGNGVMKIAFGTNATVFRNTNTPSYKGSFSYAENDDINEKGYPEEFPVKNERLKNATASDFKKIPGYPIAYWLPNLSIFNNMKASDLCKSGGRCKTHNDSKYVRYFWEVDMNSSKWRPFEKGGEYRKWYGNNYYIIDWSSAAQQFYASNGGMINNQFLNRTGITWQTVTSKKNAFRLKQKSSIYSSVSPCLFFEKDDKNDILNTLASLNSEVIAYIMKAVNPTLQANPGDVLKLPVCNLKNKENVQEIINISKIDWDSKEYSAEYKTNLILSHHKNNIISSVNSIVNSYEDKLSTATILEKEINKEIADYFSFPASIVNDLEITLNCNLE
ncbi:TPA: BREX-1 system adenine-specific DNA-methyltransferase PglX, partial [Escherichia coli]|nr:BREX-1 system adenine-specific DNA-methyltransferase PglX [Escherichia coli]